MIKRRFYRKAHIVNTPYCRFRVDVLPLGNSYLRHVQCRSVQILVKKLQVGKYISVPQQQFLLFHADLRNSTKRIRANRNRKRNK